MHVALRLGVAAVCCTLSGCGPFYRYPVVVKIDKRSMSRARVHPLAVEVFWFSRPPCDFDVLGTIAAFRLVGGPFEHAPPDQVFLLADIRKEAGRYGADLIWLQSDALETRICPDATEGGGGERCDYRHLQGIIGRRRQ